MHKYHWRNPLALELMHLQMKKYCHFPFHCQENCAEALKEEKEIFWSCFHPRLIFGD